MEPRQITSSCFNKKWLNGLAQNKTITIPRYCSRDFFWRSLTKLVLYNTIHPAHEQAVCSSNPRRTSYESLVQRPGDLPHLSARNTAAPFRNPNPSTNTALAGGEHTLTGTYLHRKHRLFPLA